MIFQTLNILTSDKLEFNYFWFLNIFSSVPDLCVFLGPPLGKAEKIKKMKKNISKSRNPSTMEKYSRKNCCYFCKVHGVKPFNVHGLELKVILNTNWKTITKRPWCLDLEAKIIYCNIWLQISLFIRGWQAQYFNFVITACDYQCDVVLSFISIKSKYI